MIPYATVKFTDIYDNADDFIEDYNGIGIPATISDESATVLFYLLYARYGNNPIANMDKTQFKYKLFSVIWQYGPSWEKRLDIQKTLRNLTEDELMTGSKQIYNHAFNPSNEPSTGSTQELDYINEQNTNNSKRSKMDAYTQLWNLIETDVTSEFLAKFINLFKKFVRPDDPAVFESFSEDSGYEEE